MYQLRRYNENGLEIYELSKDEIEARFVPARGGICTEYWQGDKALFYLDRETLFNPEKNIRGGNPVLFPICGPLENNQYTIPGQGNYTMKQHGIARNLPWQVDEVKCLADTAEITLSLESNGETLKVYPFDFKVTMTYIINDQGIAINQSYLNKSTEEMPFYAGFHPYFQAAGVKAAELNIPSSAYYDLITKTTSSYEGSLDLNEKPETNLVFSELQAKEAWFTREDGCKIRVRYDEAFNYLVLWAYQDKDFLCLEPWMGDNYDLNRGLAKQLKPGEELTCRVDYLLEGNQKALRNS